MTDTPDIAALRAGLTGQLDHMECYGGNGWVNQKDIRSILNYLDQLEAERQRADAKDNAINLATEIARKASDKIERLEDEIAALKGDQVPVANPVLAYADSYRAMARQGSDSVPIWGVITDLERNIAPLFTASQKPVEDYFSSLVAMGKVASEKAMRKYPQPNYVLLKVAEEAGEVVQAAVHYAENRMTWAELEGEVIQLIAMLNRLMVEGDQINGIKPPQAIEAAGGVVNDGNAK